MLAAPACAAGGIVMGALVEAVVVSTHPGIAAPASDAAWRGVLHDPATFASVAFSLRVALASTVGSLLLGVALFAALRAIRRPWITALVLAPVVLPHLVAAVVVAAWVGPGGIVTPLLDAVRLNVFRDPGGVGMVLAYTWKEAPFVLALLLAGAPRTLVAAEDMAQVSGLSPWSTFRHVTLPALRRPLIAAAVATCAFAVGALEIPAVLGPQSPRMLTQLSTDAIELDVVTGQSASAALAIITTLVAILSAVALLFTLMLVARRGRPGTAVARGGVR